MGQLREFLEYIFQAFKIWVIVQPWEQALIVRNGSRIKKRTRGIYFKLPYFDSVYVQEARLRVVECGMQTLSTKCGEAVTLSCVFGYTIVDLKKLYLTLYQPERTLANIAAGALAEAAYSLEANEMTPEKVEQHVMAKLKADDYGLDFQYLKISNFAMVKTFRLIQDQTWTDHGLDITQKK